VVRSLFLALVTSHVLVEETACVIPIWTSCTDPTKINHVLDCVFATQLDMLVERMREFWIIIVIEGY
jgi:hypothetical protein